MGTATITIDDKEIPYHVQIGKDPKYIHLKFTKNLELEIVLTSHSNPDTDVKRILTKKRAWIERKYHILSNRKCVFDNGRVLYRGAYYDVCVSSSDQDGSPVAIEGLKILVHAPAGDGNHLRALREWMKAETTKLVQHKLEKYAQRFGISFRNVYVKTTKQWGYCTNKGDLIFNWQLVALPDTLIDYIVLHELTHLSEFSHSKKFRVLLASMCPDFKERRQELNYFCTSKFYI